MKQQTIQTTKIISPSTLADERGRLSVLEVGRELFCPIENICWIADMCQESGLVNEQFDWRQEVVIALNGSISIQQNKNTFNLNKADSALFASNRKPEEKSIIKSLEGGSSCLILKGKNCLTAISAKEDLSPQFSVLEECRFLNFTLQKNGEVSVVSASCDAQIPFQINRVFYIYDVPSQSIERGMHAHKYCHMVLIPIVGSFEVVLDDGNAERTVILDDNNRGLYIPPGIWSVQKNYSPGTICLALASHIYSQDEYVSSYEEFKEYRKR